MDHGRAPARSRDTPRVYALRLAAFSGRCFCLVPGVLIAYCCLCALMTHFSVFSIQYSGLTIDDSGHGVWSARPMIRSAASGLGC